MSNRDQTSESTGPKSIGQRMRRSILWRIGRFCLLGMVTLITVFVLYHVEENWRGKRAWTQYKAKMEAQGAVFEVEQLAPPPVPDDQNFAMTPLLKPVLDLYPPDTSDANGNRLTWKDPDGKARAEAIDVQDRDLVGLGGYGTLPGEVEDATVALPKEPGWRMGERFDLAEWQRYYAASTNFPSYAEARTPAEDVLKALSRFDAELAELQQASQRPHSRFNIRYEEENPITILLPHLGILRNIARVAQLKAVAELGAGQIDAAFEDVQLLFALADSIRDEPFLISQLVRIALLNLATQTVWEGMVDHQWTAAQLEQFEQRCLAMDLVTSLRRSIEAERTFGAEIIELGVHNPSLLLDIESSTGSGGLAGLAMNLVPRGWWYLEGVNHSRAFDDYMLAALPDDPGELDVQSIQSRYDELASALAEQNPVKAVLQHRFIMRLLVPALGKAAERSVEGQSLAGLATVAIALERYHLANGSYPVELSALTPEFIPDLPDDPVGHEPFRYELTTDGAYRLWSVGWNSVDDGGVVLYEPDGDERDYVRDQLDWVWPSVEGMRFREKTD